MNLLEPWAQIQVSSVAFTLNYMTYLIANELLRADKANCIGKKFRNNLDSAALQKNVFV